MKKRTIISCAADHSYTAPGIVVEERAAEQGFLNSAPIEDIEKDEEVPFI